MEDPGPPGAREVWVGGWVVLDFLSTTDVGRRVSAEEEAASEVSEAEVREVLEEQGAAAVEPAPGDSTVPTHA